MAGWLLAMLIRFQVDWLAFGQPDTPKGRKRGKLVCSFGVFILLPIAVASRELQRGNNLTPDETSNYQASSLSSL